MQWIKRAARLLAGASMSAACVAAVAADVPVVFDVGSLHVERHGGRGSPIVVIPGLASGSWVWQDVVAALQTEHRVYAVTLAGFDGRPRVAGDGVALATRQLRYMQRVGVISAEKAAALAVLTARSDPAATADYAARIMTLDLRPQLRSIHVPVMELCPFTPATTPRPASTKRARRPTTDRCSQASRTWKSSRSRRRATSR